jgi:hypothetical protein
VEAVALEETREQVAIGVVVIDDEESRKGLRHRHERE